MISRMLRQLDQIGLSQIVIVTGYQGRRLKKHIISGRNFDFNHTEGCYKTVNIYKFSKAFSETHYVPFLNAYQKVLGENEYYEQVLRVIVMLEDAEIRGLRLSGQSWYEIDDIQDLDIARMLFCPNGEEKVRRFEERYGGYWRFPDMLDFCYLVNPYFPPQKMLDKMTGNVGIIRPTFEEYPNRLDDKRIVVYEPENRDCAYHAKDVMRFFEDKDIQLLIVINPDNPSGNYRRFYQSIPMYLL